jgi:hypothetical protein
MMNKCLTVLTLLSVVLLGSTQAWAKEPAPEDRTYLVYVVGLSDDPYETMADCLTFDASQACTPDRSTCLSWQRTEGGVQTGRESGFSFFDETDDEGVLVTIEGQGRVDSRGAKSSISAVAQAFALGQRLNFSFSGRQIGLGKCLNKLEELAASQDP